MNRERFLARVSSRLDNAGGDSGASGPPKPTLPRRDAPRHRTGLVRLFTDRLTEVGGTVTLSPDRGAALASITALLRRRRDMSIACPRSLAWADIEAHWTADSRRAAFGLSLAQWGVADTGTLVLHHEGPQARGYSLVPAASGFLLPVSGLVPHLGRVIDDIQTRPREELPACITFVTGPSHSADIAGVTCNGVHGPGEVQVWLIADE